MWVSAGIEASRPKATNTQGGLHQPPAFNLIVAVVIGVCFGAWPGFAQDSVVGRWDNVTNSLPFFPVHSHTLPTGKVMIWPGDEGISGNDARSWDPANQSVSTLAPPGFDVFCTGHSFLADGRLFVAGGHIQNNVGLPNASIYNPVANAWTALPAMNAGRWYPTATVLANGDVLVVSGSIDNVVGVNTLPQVFQVATGTWRNLAELGMELYPHMLLAPNGKVFNAGPTQNTRYLDTAGSGAWSFVANRVGPHRSYGSAVMYAPGKVLVMGGGDPPTSTAEVIDLNQAAPAWRAVGSMAFARRQLNATLLPDGTVLVTGGTSSAGFNDPTGMVHAAELWNPTTEQWTTLASTTSGIPRVYHSTAVLLPDGRVLSMGGNVLQGYPDTRTAEIYSPPYLFKGTRPTITSAPTSVAYGQSFFAGTPNAAAISKVTMLRLSSVTHAFNMSQHINTLSFSQAPGGLNIVAPPGAAVAPPGHYLLFILNGSGVPSVARIVQVGGSNAAVPTLTSLSPSSAAAGGPAFTLTVNGGNFVNGSVVRWNGTNRTTTFVNGAQLTAAIPAADISAVGSASVTVQNPGGAVSSALAFTITSSLSAISREVWTGIGGSAVADIPVGSAPNLTDTQSSFEAPLNWADNYGTRMRGYITAPVSGNYTFWIASDDNSELWLSTNDNPANKVRIASVSDWTSWHEWNKLSTQRSAAIPLTAGQRYYVEALQKEGGGGDNLAVGWAKPGEATTAPSEVIPGSVLSPFSGTTAAGPEINVQGNGTTINDGDTTASGADHTDFGSTALPSGTVTRTFTIQNLGTQSLSVGTVTLSGANAADFSVVTQPASPVAAGGTTSFQVRFTPTAAGTRSATVSLGNNDADENPYNFAVAGSGVTAGSGSVSREVWTGVSGTTVASIPVGSAPNLTDTQPSFEAPLNWADNYGTRMRGYITAPVSGNYTFWIASDDNSELWLSTNDNSVNKVTIASVADYTDPRQWTKYATQKSPAMTLTAGQRYYVEALQKEGGGGDNLAVGWAKPGEATTAPSEVIPGSVLSPFSGTTAAGPEINVQGNGTTINDGDTTASGADHTDFGSTALPSGTVTRTFTIQNLGTQSLSVGTVTLSGANAADFSVVTQPASPVAAGGTTSFQVRFTPTAAGTRSATVSLGNNDADENPYNFAVAGSGVTAGSGSVSREVWTGVSGTTVASIPVGSAPNLTDTQPSFEAPLNWADNYGTRMRGYITAPVSGNYTFWIASDDNSELWLSTNDNSVNKVTIASVADYTDPRQWTKYATQKSPAMTLTAGQRYYVEALQKEGGGGDNLAVGWAKPGEATTAPSEVIPGSVLSPFSGTTAAGPEINVQGNGTTINDGDTTASGADHTDFGSTALPSGTVTRTFTIQNLGTQSLSVGTVTLSGANAADFSVVTQPASPVAAGGTTSFQVRFTPTAAGTRSATVSLGNNDADENPYNFAVAGSGVTAGSGSVSREVWTGVSGTTVASIPVGSAPNLTDTQPSFEAPLNWADNYGTRMRGYITAPVSGNYTFWIASDDNSELWLSTNDNPANKVRIASVSDWTSWHEWNKLSTQRSAAIPLTAGQRYYVEALQKEGGGGDNLAVGWAKPGEATTAPSEVIPGSVLSPFSGTTAAGPEINVQGNGTTINDGDTTASGADHTDFGSTALPSGTVTRTFTIQNLGTQSLSVGTVTLSGANAADFSVVTQPASPVAAGGTTSFQVRFTPTAAGTRSASVSLGNNDADENPYNFAVAGSGATAGSGSVSREVWTGVSGTTVASIPVGSAPNLTDTQPSFEAPSNWADNYGTRMRGYITAPVSGNYTFWIASDDNSELWLSTNDNSVNKVRIASVSDYTDPRQWNRFSTQKSAAIPLIAGQRYYVEALQKEGGGGDNLAVGWAKPGEATTAPSEVIPGSVLSPFSGGGQ